MKYFTIFLILCVLSNAAECTTGGDSHCAKCRNEEVCGTKINRCVCCEEGYTYDTELKCKCDTTTNRYSETSDKKCVKCDIHCTSGCKSKGADKCDSACMEGWKLENDVCNKKCSIDHCAVCKDENTCNTCEIGYEKKDSDKKCEKIDCSGNDATHCELCTDKKAAAQCVQCESGYAKESYGSDNKCKDLKVCEWEEDTTCGKDHEYLAYENGKCYNQGSGSYIKIDGNKVCAFEDSKCEKVLKEPKYEKKIDGCVKVEDKWYKYKEDDCKVKEYDNDKCDNGKDITSVCKKNGDKDYWLITKDSQYVTFYEAEGCPADKIVKVDSECETLSCKGSGAVMNMVILAVLIISFMIWSYSNW